MDTLIDIVQFRSGRFTPALPEECQVNPEVYGAELAFWLSAELAHRGVVTSYPQSEDWGWFIEFGTDSGSEFVVHCINVEGANDIWLLSLRRHARKMFGRDKPPYSEAAPLVAGIKDSVQSVVPASDIQWLYGSTSAV